MRHTNVKAVADELDSFLSEMSKEAALVEERPTTEQLKKEPQSEQTNIGKEQQVAAEEAGAMGSPNKAVEAGNTPQSEISPEMMDMDDKVENKSKAITNIKKEEQTMQQKTAELERLGEGIVNLLEKAAQEQGTSDEYTSGIPSEMVKVANQAAESYRSRYLAGMVKRANDEQYLISQGIPAKKASALLDKLAMEDPAAVLPEEVIAEEGMVADVPAEGEEKELDAIAEAMEAMGVTPEMLEQAMSLVDDLKAQGYTEEEIASEALAMLEETAPVPEEDVVEEDVVEEDVVEEGAEKEASYNISKLKAILRRK